VKINIHEQIYAWREVMEEKGQIQLAKKGAMIAASNLLSRPQLYRIAASTAEPGLSLLPRFAIYNRLNAWGKHREIPQLGHETFHSWYKKNRGEVDVQETKQ
jgi:L-lactate dehydrogenase complex protein LldF